MRLNRYLASAGCGSRRGCETLIREGRVTINGQVCTDLSSVVAEGDFVKLNGHRVVAEKQLYVLLHKPRGFLCTAADTHERRTIFDLLPHGWPRVFHVGRLDKESEGLLILTNDGDLSLRLTHPRYKIEKEYEVLLTRAFDPRDREKMLKGIFIEGGRAKADAVHVTGPAALRIILRQGLKRQIRLMLGALGYDVKRLVRNRIGPLRLQDMPPGSWRMLTGAEVATLRQAAKPSAGPPMKEARAVTKPARDTAARAPARRRDAPRPRSSR